MARLADKPKEKTEEEQTSQEESTVISQLDLKKLAGLQQEERDLKKALETAEKSRKLHEAEMVARLERGDRITRGALTGKVIQKSLGRRPDYKSAFIAEMGQAAADELKTNTVAKSYKIVEITART